MRRYTRFVHMSQGFLWVLVAIMVVVVVWIASGHSSMSPARIAISNIPHSGTLENSMINPRYQGMNAQNQPYTVAADKAIQKDANTVLMQAVRADMMRSNGSWLGLNSKTGELNMQTKKMQLTGGVSLFADGGYEFRSDHADVDIQQSTAYGDSPVEGQGPPGTITADSFSANGKKHVIVFKGNVKMVLYR